MKITCIADLHGYQPDLPGGDILIIAGDLTACDTEKNWVDFEDWLCNQEYKEKIIIGGNHDNFLQSTDAHCMWKYWEKVGVTYLCDSGTEFCGMKIWGSPYTTKFPGINPKCCAFTENYGCDSDEWLNEHWQLIPDDIDILVTHSPPYGIFDETRNSECVGSKSLFLKMRQIKPLLHVFGHIHEEGGKHLTLNRGNRNTICVNASIMNEKYRPVNQPITIEI